jgi:hypothetical protein
MGSLLVSSARATRGRRRAGGSGQVPLVFQSPHDETVVARCAQATAWLLPIDGKGERRRKGRDRVAGGE